MIIFHHGMPYVSPGAINVHIHHLGPFLFLQNADTVRAKIQDEKAIFHQIQLIHFWLGIYIHKVQLETQHSNRSTWDELAHLFGSANNQIIAYKDQGPLYIE